MQVPLRCSDIGVTRKLLDHPPRRTSHRQVRAERMPQHVHTTRLQFRCSCRMIDVIRDHVFADWRSLRVAKDPRPFQVPSGLQRLSQSSSQRKKPLPTALWRDNVPLPD
jgi:hypothetical protein